MNKSFCLRVLALVLLVMTAGSALAQRQVLDKVVAIVDEGVVLQSELTLRMDEARQQMQASGQPMPPPTVLREQALESLIVENLQLQLIEPDPLVTDGTERLQRVALGAPDVPAAAAALRERGVHFVETQRLHVDVRGALTQSWLGGLMFELIHVDA